MKKIVLLAILCTAMLPSGNYCMEANARTDKFIDDMVESLRKQTPKNNRVICPICSTSLQLYVRSLEKPDMTVFNSTNAKAHLRSAACRQRIASLTGLAVTTELLRSKIKFDEDDNTAVNALESLKDDTNYTIKDIQALTKKLKKRVSTNKRKKPENKCRKIHYNDDSDSDYSPEEDKPDYRSDILIECQLCDSKCSSRLIQQHYEKEHFLLDPNNG